MEHGIKISTPAARLANGAVLLPSDKYVFHLIHSRTLCMALSYPGSELPAPVLFSRFSKTNDGDCTLQSDADAALSLVRILISNHPYVLNSRLSVGYQRHGGTVVLHRRPLVITDEFGSSPVKLSSSIVVGPDPLSANGTAPATAELAACALVCASSFKSVWINESANTEIHYDPGDAIEVPLTPNLPCKSIIKKDRCTPASEEAASLNARLFFACSAGYPPIGQCPARSFTTLMIMCKSHNSLRPVPEFHLKPLQLLLVKHTLLVRMGLENCMQDFILTFPDLPTVSAEQVEHFEKIVAVTKARVEDIIFALNSVSAHIFERRVRVAAAHPVLDRAMRKYFLMFPPADLENSVNFATDIVKIICKGVPFEQLVRFLKRYIPIQEITVDTNHLKVFALLSI
ncbi:ORF23 [Ovine gammaherpesvirus 2]|uniref:ORF23 n=1 Tax=Ovine gammaherpesvirus 2 TaxID=10398 RepID=Q2VSL7_9GAMA|nr:ORF23 [Ovine gammaherpesvirus 2]AAX58059.1 ORF23 [Ovine gammaherpesvirus 2]ABB22241.1 hypothetical protein OvHV-2gp21 [Ovine gammaherpesvirus 2]WOZ69468.1 ORF23 cytoplasmic egress facilitator-2 [Ovine gammaherpesvirus 2]